MLGCLWFSVRDGFGWMLFVCFGLFVVGICVTFVDSVYLSISCYFGYLKFANFVAVCLFC